MPLTQRKIFWFWLPLAASWLLMGLEAPFVNAMLARLSEAERMLAAFGIVASLSITIESPVIMLLATSTALARSPQSYRQLRRFTWHLIGLTTLIHALISFTPLFDVVVRDWMGTPEILLDPIRLGMQLMLPWSGAIAWRRFTQGVLIRSGQTRYVGQGTVVRLLTSAGLAAALGYINQRGLFPGIVVGTLALSVGVIVEAAYAHLVARPHIAQHFDPAHVSTEPDLSYRALVNFHAPLAASTLLFLLTQPMISAALARLPDPTHILAAWPVTSGLLFITRAPVLALPEVIIALMGLGATAGVALRRFSLTVGAVCMGVLAMLSFTPLAHFYFQQMIGVSPELAALAATGAQLGVLLPMFMAWQSWFRGLLTTHKITFPITVSMAANLVTMALTLVVGVWAQVPGVVLAVIALTLATVGETLVLWWAARNLNHSSIGSIPNNVLLRGK